MGFFVFVVTVVLLLMILSLRGRADQVEQRLFSLANEVRDLQLQITRLKRGAAVPVAEPESAAERVPEPAPVPQSQLRLDVEAAPKLQPNPEPAREPAVQPKPMLEPIPGLAVRASVASDVGPRKQPAEVPAPAASRVAVVQPSRPAPPAPAEASRSGGFDWESLVGVKLFSGIAAVALLIGAILFLRIAVEKGWLEPPIRVVMGIVVSVGLLLFCERRAAGRYRVTANALDAAAVTILYSTFYAAHALWHLFDSYGGGLLTFGLLALVTVLAVMLAIRRSSMFIAALGLLGGFAAPALLSTGQDNPIGLFGYLVLLNTGLAWVARRKGWVRLLMAALAFTTFYQWSWVAKFLRPDNVPVAVGVFLTFPVLAYLLLTLGGMARRDSDTAAQPGQQVFRMLTATSAVLPYLAVFYFIVPPLGDQFLWLFGLLFLLDAGLLAVALGLNHEDLHMLGGMCTVTVMLLWLGIAYSSAAWPLVLPIICAFVVFYLLAPFVARWLGRSFAGNARYAVYAAPVMLVSFSMLVAREPATAAPGLLFGVLFMLLAAMAGVAIAWRRGDVYFAGAFLAAAAEAMWSGRYLAPETLLSALFIYSAFSALYLAVPVFARLRGTGEYGVRVEGLYVGLVGHVFLVAVAGSAALAVPPWPIFGVLAALLLAVAAVALYVRRADLHVTSIALAVLLVLVWESVAWGEPWPTMAVVAAIALALFGAAWLWAAGRRGVTGAWVPVSIVVAIVGAQAVIIGASVIPGAPALWLLASVQVALLCALLLTSWRTTWGWLAPAALVPAFAAPAYWVLSPHTGSNWLGGLLFGALIYAVFIGFPVSLGRRVGASLHPYVAAAIANVPFFLIAYWALEQGGYHAQIGVLPVTQAIVMAGLLVMLLRLEAPGQRTLGRLAIVAAAALAGVTLAIPLQLENQWLTVGWALEGAALAWLFTRVPHRGLLWWSAVLMAAVFVRLAANPDIFSYAPRGDMRIVNWYLYTYLVSSAAFIAVGKLLWQTDDLLHEQLPVRVSRLGPSAAAILLFILLNIEIADFYSVGPSIMFEFGGATLAQNLTYTLGWGVFGVSLLVVGIVFHSRAARVAALVLLVVTVFKCFLFDLGRLTGLYRVGSFVGLAICLAFVAIILQKYVLARPAGGKS